VRTHTDRAQLSHAQPRSLSGGLRYSFSVCAAVLVMVSMAISLESSIATARSGPDASVEMVNRARKGDRVSLVQRQFNGPRAAASASTLPDGCDSVVSSLTRSDLARRAQYCES
jgi:hypothetical protein